jgi:ribosomal protein S18 acetylase RimI-like enzyme
MTTYDVVTEVDDDDSAALYPVYQAVFGDEPDYSAWRSEIWDPHSTRAGFRLARAYEGGRLVGFGYGYTGERGQWWTDQAARVLPRDVADEWLGGHFEIVSIGVVADWRRAGCGRGLLRRLCAGLTHDRWLLMTSADAEDPARHLYATEGWTVIGPGLRDDQAIMGRRRA